MNNLSDLQRQWTAAQNNAGEANAWIARELARIDAQCDRLIGPGFRRAFGATGCRTEIDFSDESIASYLSFHVTTGYKNEIRLGRAALDNECIFFQAIFHERLHALQYTTAAALHASLYNPFSDIALCPLHLVWANELSERDAYAKGLIPEKQLAFAGTRDYQFDEVRQWPGIPRDILHAIEAFAMNVHTSDGKTLRDNYNREALSSICSVLYLCPLRRRRQFVRLETEDIIAIGNSYGVNLFSADGVTVEPGYRQQQSLSPENMAVLKQVNRLCNIKDEALLPTFGEALAARGLTRQTFLDLSRARRPMPAPFRQARAWAWPFNWKPGGAG